MCSVWGMLLEQHPSHRTHSLHRRTPDLQPTTILDNTLHCCNYRLTLLKMGKRLPETCWADSKINKIVTVASIWPFILFTHLRLTTVTVYTADCSRSVLQVCITTVKSLSVGSPNGMRFAAGGRICVFATVRIPALCHARFPPSLHPVDAGTLSTGLKLLEQLSLTLEFT